MSPETTEIITVAVFVIIVVAVLWQQYKTGKPITVADVVAAVEVARPITERVRTVAEGIVLANEQIKRDGQLTNEQAYAKAFAVVRREFPLASGVTDEEIIREINRAVLIGSKMTADINRTKVEGA